MQNAIEMLIDEFKKQVQPATKPVRKIKPVRIKIKSTGQWLLTFSRKTIWKRKGDASNALSLFLEYVWCNAFKYDPQVVNGRYYIGPDKNRYTTEQRDVILQAAKDHIKKELIEFVEVDS